MAAICLGSHEELTSLRRRNRWFTRRLKVQTGNCEAALASQEFIMLKTARAIFQSRRLKASFAVEITGVATAVPRNKLLQAEAARRAKRLFPELADYESLFRREAPRCLRPCRGCSTFGATISLILGRYCAISAYVIAHRLVYP
jgi:hypothetical protein